MDSSLPQIEILGIKIHPLTRKELKKKTVYCLKNGQQHYFVTINPEFVLTAIEDESFRQILNLADLSLADGNGLIWASHFLQRPVKIAGSFPPEKRKAYRKRKIRNQVIFTLLANLFFPRSVRSVIPERLAGSDIILDICQILAENDLSLYLLGGDKETILAAKFALEKKFPNLIISGIKSGFSKDQSDDQELLKAVQKTKPDVLFVALGHPFQEKWIFHHLDQLPTVKLAIGVGGSLDFLGGKLRRAPDWMRKVNLEWLFRLFQEPRRFSRIRKATYQFIKEIYRYKIRQNAK